MISVLLEAYKVLGLNSARDLALRTLDLLMERAYDPARGMGHALVRPTKSEGSPQSPRNDFRVSNFDLLDDQVFMTGALLDAYEVTGNRAYYDRAVQLMDTTVKRFMDREHGGFFDTAKDGTERQGALTMERKAFQDSPTPAANAQAVLVLDRLARLAGREDFGAAAQATLDLFAPKAHQYGLFAATYALALINHLRPPIEIVVVGSRDDERTRQLLAAAHQAPRAGKHVLCFEPATLIARDLPAGLSATLPQLPYNGRPLALVCVGTTCQQPVETPEALTAILQAESPSNFSA